VDDEKRGFDSGVIFRVLLCLFLGACLYLFITNNQLFALEAVGRVTDKALLVHGGLGYLKSSRIEMLYRDARLNWLEEGTPTIHKLIIARTLLQEEYATFGRGAELI